MHATSCGARSQQMRVQEVQYERRSPKRCGQETEPVSAPAMPTRCFVERAISSAKIVSIAPSTGAATFCCLA